MTYLQLEAFDSSLVSMVSLSLNSDGFDNFQCDRDQTLGINIPEFIGILKYAEINETFMMKTLNNSDTVDITFTSPNQKMVKCR